MKVITFQKFSWNHILFLAFFIVSLCRRRTTDPLFVSNIQKSGYFFEMYVTILSHYISIIPHIITKCLSKSVSSEEKSDKKKDNRFYYIYNDKDDYKGRGLYKSTFLASLFEFLALTLIFLFYFLNNEPKVVSIYVLNVYLIFNTVTLYIISYLVLKTYFYKHHYLSFLINSVCILIVLIFDIIKIIQLDIEEYQYYIFVVLRIIRIILFCFGNCYSKIALYSAFLSPYSLLLYKAIYETFFLLIFSIPFIFIKMSELYVENGSIFIGFRAYLSGIKILYSIILFILDFLYDLVLLAIIDKFSPNHLALAHILESFGSSIYSIIKNFIEEKENSWSLYATLPIYVVLFIGAMIHNEIFIINKWGLNLKTKLYLDSKFEEESLINDNANEDIDEDDSNKKENNEENKILMDDVSRKE